MIPAMIIIGFVLLLAVMIITSQSAVVPWMDEMTRRHAGIKNQAEWIAPNHIIEQVKRDYLEFHRYATQTLPKGWVAYGRDLHRYLCDALLREQRESLTVRLQHDRGRVVDILRATHDVYVRHFSGDGMRCVLIDHQSDQRMASYDYWSGKRLHTQDLGDCIYVYIMQYNRDMARWRIATAVQQMRPNSCQPVSLDLHPPQAVGRDH